MAANLKPKEIAEAINEAIHNSLNKKSVYQTFNNNLSGSFLKNMVKYSSLDYDELEALRALVDEKMEAMKAEKIEALQEKKREIEREIDSLSE